MLKLTISVFLYVTIIASAISSWSNANPILGLFDSNCFTAQGECPNQNISFWLYTNATRNAPKQLLPQMLNPWDFQPVKPIKILIHGYTGHRDFSPNEEIRPVLLDVEDVYVISVDYAPFVRLPCYFAAVDNLPLVAKCLAQLINNLLDQGVAQNEQLHVIGFSLGAQVAGQLSNYLKRKLKRITGLDPAKPMFISTSTAYKLDPTDAEFVDVIHTDVLGRGMLRSMGHIDFFPNIGPFQPGCQVENPSDPGSCNHDRAPRYYAESIHSEHGFWSYACPSWLHNMFGFCNSNSNDALMGYHVNDSITGSHFLKTYSTSPFAMGPSNLSLALKYENNSLLQSIADFDFDFEPQLTRGFFEHPPDYAYADDDADDEYNAASGDYLSNELSNSLGDYYDDTNKPTLKN